jgi:hypothetical protein
MCAIVACRHQSLLLETAQAIDLGLFLLHPFRFLFDFPLLAFPSSCSPLLHSPQCSSLHCGHRILCSVSLMWCHLVVARVVFAVGVVPGLGAGGYGACRLGRCTPRGDQHRSVLDRGLRCSCNPGSCTCAWFWVLVLGRQFSWYGLRNIFWRNPAAAFCIRHQPITKHQSAQGLCK